MSFQQGLSGLNATSKSLDVIGNNIANASTYGAKSARAEFADIYAASLSGATTSQPGIGVTVATVAQQFTQGNITTTGNPLDLAINGLGFFQTQNAAAQTVYTRNGQFKLDRQGFITNDQSNKLLGYAADGLGNIIPGKAVPLQLPTGGISPAVTGKNTMQFNLDSRAKVTLPAVAPPAIDFTNQATYNNATSVTMYDAKGQDIAVTYYFQKSATDTWNVYATANGQTIAGSAAAPAPVIAGLQFAADGSTIIAPSPIPPMAIPATTTAAGVTTLAIPAVAMDLSGSTQFGANFGVTNMLQTGYAAGQLTGVTVDDVGHLVARYSNGQTKTAGQLEVANFRNPQGLQSLGGNGWERTFVSGDPILGVPGDGNLGNLQSGALEESNVDLTAELVALMTAQRDYQANAQTIKTMDQAMQTLVNLR